MKLRLFAARTVGTVHASDAYVCGADLFLVGTTKWLNLT